MILDRLNKDKMLITKEYNQPIKPLKPKTVLKSKRLKDKYHK